MTSLSPESAYAIFLERNPNATREEAFLTAWQMCLTRSPEASADEKYQLYRRLYGLSIENLRINEKREVNWIALDCGGVESSLEAVGSRAAAQKGDRRQKDGRIWECTDPDIDRWITVDEPSTGICFFCGEPINGKHEDDCPQAPQPDDRVSQVATVVKDLIETLMLWNGQASAGLDVRGLAGLRDELVALAAQGASQ
ncbi:hypothetical protein [Paraburkholderia sp. J11-2]|uniref:hypothetical protein n=1 Tax=Paraburkholderia sp. J11-2 TaxID=2805431 RepID=UPI002AB717E2|nr:hypothetical protein [Paraburkholderia sp. J11-2]